MASSNSIRPKDTTNQVLQKESGMFGVSDRMKERPGESGDLKHRHPLAYSEAHWDENAQKLNYSMLRNTQGLHAPLRLQLELSTAKKIQRLPCLHSSNLAYQQLTGKLDDICPEDIYNDPRDAEVMGHPHALMEKELGIL